MDRTRIIAAAVVISAALVALIATYWYVFLYQPGRATHAAYTRPDTAVTLAVQPARIQWYITKLAPGFTKYIESIPKFTSTQSFSGRIDWVHAMPYEISMLYHHGTQETLDVTMFINTHPNDPDFGQRLAQAGFFRVVGWVNWKTGAFARKRDAQYASEGTLHITPETQQTIAQFWNSNAMMNPPDYEGGHFIELRVDNGGGALMALHEALIRGASAVRGRDINAYLMDRWPGVRKVHLTSDLTDDDLVEFHVTVDCASPADTADIMEAMDYLEEEIAFEFEAMGFAFEGTERADGARIQGDYSFYGFEDELRRALGN